MVCTSSVEKFVKFSMQPNPIPPRNVRFEQFDGHSINGVYVLLPENEVQAVKLISIKLANKQIKNCADVTKCTDRKNLVY